MNPKTQYIDVGILTTGAPLLRPVGDYDIRRLSDNQSARDAVIYTPLHEDSRLSLLNLKIGKEFHWQQTVETLLPGTVTVRLTPAGEWETINRLPLEEYLQCVIGSEMNPAAPEEFLKAHCIISRSWALGKIRRSHKAGGSDSIISDDCISAWEDTADHSGFDVCSDDHCQRYQGISDMQPKIKRIVKNTEGMVLTDADGNLADTRYSKCCGGRTELFSTCWQEIDYPYLVSQPDSYCDLSGMSAQKREQLLRECFREYDTSAAISNDWELTVSRNEIRNRLSSLFGKETGDVIDMKIETRGLSGRAKCLLIKCESENYHVGKELTIRRLLSKECLRSSLFDITRLSDGNFRIKGKGWGHGVGLCQTGAARMASEGASYYEILSFYYPGTKITTIE